MVAKVPQPHDDAPEFAPPGGEPYVWSEMGFFTRWDAPGRCRVLCVDTPRFLQTELLIALNKQLPAAIAATLRDPLALHRPLIEQVLVLYDISVWRIRDQVRQIEKVPLPLINSIYRP